jgi:hypothetical protein
VNQDCPYRAPVSYVDNLAPLCLKLVLSCRNRRSVESQKLAAADLPSVITSKPANDPTRDCVVLLRAVLRLRYRVRAIKEESYHLFEYFFPDVDGTVDAIARLRPIHFAHSDVP